MSTPTLLRLALWGALGLAPACAPATAIIDGPETDPPDPGPCGDYPLLTPENAELQQVATYTVCAAADPGETCPPADELEVWSFLSQALGPHPEPDFCGWYGEDVCGPTPSDEGECCYVMLVSSICEGRPLLAAEHRADHGAGPTDAITAPANRTAWASTGEVELPAMTDATRRAGARWWTRAALAEHASIASFARAAMELLAAGAPPDLVGETVQAQLDELRHAEQAFAIASAFAGRDVGPGALPTWGAGPRTTLPDIVVGLIREGCVNETLAAAEATEAARRCKTAVVRDTLTRIAHDETRHAALAWRTLQWLVAAHPELRDLARRTLWSALEFRGTPAPDPATDAAAAQIGALSGQDRAALASSVVRTVLEPLAVDVLGGPERTCPSL